MKILIKSPGPRAPLLSSRIVTSSIYVLAFVPLAISVFYSLKYSGQPILELHSFRQTQTALTTFWIARQPLVFPYETPVLGFPWSIPFEFPLYQYLVAGLSTVLSADLQQTGRLVSYSFLLLCLIPVGSLLRKLFPQNWRQHFAVFAVIFLSSPLYLFWGRAFMIETAALFLALWFVNAAVPIMELRWKTSDLVWVSITLTLALLQKVTTVLPLLAIVIAILLSRLYRRRRVFRLTWASVMPLASAFVLPLLIGYFWVAYTDVVKLQNGSAHFLTSTALSHFNYGPLRYRFTPGIYWNVLWKRVAVQNIAGIAGVLCMAAGLIWLDGAARKLILLCLAAFLLPFLFVENLHRVHDYYQTANAIFLILGVSTAISCLAAQYSRLSLLATPVLLFVMSSNLWFFKHGYAGFESLRFGNNYTSLAIAKVIRTHTTPDQPILVFGYDWSSELPFFSQRRGLAVPSYLPWSDAQKTIDRASQSFAGTKPGAIVVCSAPGAPALDISKSRPNFKSIHIANCDVFVAR